MSVTEGIKTARHPEVARRDSRSAKDRKDKPPVGGAWSPPEAVLYYWARGVNSGERVSEVVDLYADDALLWPTFSSEPLVTRAQLQGYFQKLMASGKTVAVDEASLSVKAIGEGYYVLTGKYIFEVYVAGRKQEIPSRFTFVLNVFGQHPIAHHHSSVIP